MTDPSQFDRPDWHAVTGSGEVSERELAVLRLPAERREARHRAWRMALAPMVGGVALVAVLDLLVWLIAGAPAYMGVGQEQPVTLLALLATPAYALALWLAGRHRLLALTWCLPTTAIMVVVAEAQFMQALDARGTAATETFFIQRVDLIASGMRSFRHDRIMPEAILTMRDGSTQTVHAAQAWMRRLTGQDCLTVRVRWVGGYGFPEGPITLKETPYADSIDGTRHPERCFAR